MTRKDISSGVSLTISCWFGTIGVAVNKSSDLEVCLSSLVGSQRGGGSVSSGTEKYIDVENMPQSVEQGSSICYHSG